jgi:tRNA(Arg) A34 adenosine deaminase TadA
MPILQQTGYALMPGQLDDADRRYLQRAIQISRRAVDEGDAMPFGALVVIDGRIAGESANRVAELHDPTAHAEVMALRAAGAALGTHEFEAGVLYSSSEPCPMCLTACYWARLPRVVFGATSYDVDSSGIEDLQFYLELTRPRDQRSLREDPAGEELRQDAAAAVRAWADKARNRG